MVAEAVLEPFVLAGKVKVSLLEIMIEGARQSRTGRLWIDCSYFLLAFCSSSCVQKEKKTGYYSRIVYDERSRTSLLLVSGTTHATYNGMLLICRMISQMRSHNSSLEVVMYAVMRDVSGTQSHGSVWRKTDVHTLRNAERWSCWENTEWRTSDRIDLFSSPLQQPIVSVWEDDKRNCWRQIYFEKGRHKEVGMKRKHADAQTETKSLQNWRNTSIHCRQKLKMH